MPKAKIQTKGAAAPAVATLPPLTRAPAEFLFLRHDEIAPDPDNARKDFDAAKLLDLASTLATHGMLQAPVVTAPSQSGAPYVLVMGERRWRAWGLLIADGRWAVDLALPCRLETADNKARMEASLIENLQRVDLNHMEAGLAFETLGKRFHLANKAIAARIGRSAEFVQQHRRLAELDEDDQQRLRDGELRLHDALRIVNRPRPETLTPRQLLIMAEVAHRIGAQPSRGYSYYGQTECAHDAKGGDLTQLTNSRLLEFRARDHQSQRAAIALGYDAAVALGADRLKVLKTKGAEADAALAKIYAETCFSPLGTAKPPAPGVYVMAWLNGPFPLHPDAVKELARLKADRAGAAKEAAATKARRAASRASIDALREVLATTPPAADPRMVAAFGKLKLPFRVAPNGTIVDHAGVHVCRPDWHFQEEIEATALVLALALNVAGGFGHADDFSRQIAEVAAEVVAEREPAGAAV